MEKYMIGANKDAEIRNCSFYGDEWKIVLRRHGKIKNCTIDPDVTVIDNRAWYIKLWRKLFDKQAQY